MKHERTYHFPPGRMRAKTAAYYLGIGEKKLRDGAGLKYPAPVRDGRYVLWRKVDLDRYIEQDGTCYDPFEQGARIYEAEIEARKARKQKKRSRLIDD